MKSFVSAIIVTVILAVGFAWVLDSFQKTAEAQFHTVSARP
jgi:hypothetical protein